jgi:hypothetical protein
MNTASTAMMKMTIGARSGIATSHKSHTLAIFLTSFIGILPYAIAREYPSDHSGLSSLRASSVVLGKRANGKVARLHN